MYVRVCKGLQTWVINTANVSHKSVQNCYSISIIIEATVKEVARFTMGQLL